MLITYTCTKYSPDDVRKRYVYCSSVKDQRFRFFEVGEDRRYDLRQGNVTADELPDDVRRASEGQSGMAQGYVEWPFTIEEKREFVARLADAEGEKQFAREVRAGTWDHRRDVQNAPFEPRKLETK